MTWHDEDRCYWTKCAEDGLWYFIPVCWSCIHMEAFPEPREKRPRERPSACTCGDSDQSIDSVVRQIHSLIAAHGDDLATLRRIKRAINEIGKERHEHEEEDPRQAPD